MPPEQIADARTLEVYRLNARSRWEELESYDGDLAVRAEPFDAIELDLSTLWGW